MQDELLKVTNELQMVSPLFLHETMTNIVIKDRNRLIADMEVVLFDLCANEGSEDV